MTDRALMHDTRMARRSRYFACGTLQVAVTIVTTGAGANVGWSVWVGGGIVHSIAKIFQGRQGNARNLLFAERVGQYFIL